jgi:hypothetical protein
VTAGVYRAPMRSRRDDVDPFAAVERALTLGLCGMGEADDEPAARRLERFAAVPDGAFVWTRDVDGLTYLGRLAGELRRDASLEAVAVDLVHVRGCTWRQSPVPDQHLPPAVTCTFGRGGRNFQQIHDPDVARLTQALWDRLD